MKAWVAKKYRTAYLMQLKNFTEYKLKLFAVLIKPILRIIILCAVWYELFILLGKQSIAGLDMYMFLMYLVLSGFIKVAVLPWTTADAVTDDIKTGNLSSIITKPVNYLKLVYSNLLAEISLVGFYGLIVFLSISYIGSLISDNIYFPNALLLFLFLISVLLALSIAYFFYFIIACASFWFGDNWSIIGGIINIQSFLSGELIPLSISPTLLFVSNFMPFKFMTFTPTFIYLGKYTLVESLMQIGGQIIWLVILLLLAKYILKKGIQHFEAQGG